MSARQTPITRILNSVLDASPVSSDLAAELLGLRPDGRRWVLDGKQLRNQLNPCEESHKFHADLLIPLATILNTDVVAEQAAWARGGVFVRPDGPAGCPAMDPLDVLNEAVAASEEITRFLREVYEAYRNDRRFDERERARIEAAGYRPVQRVLQAIAMLKTLARREGLA